jgi:hypothetical protein
VLSVEIRTGDRAPATPVPSAAGSPWHPDEMVVWNPILANTLLFISSLNEAWFYTLDNCLVDILVNEVIFYLMRSCLWRSNARGSLAGERSR